MNHDNDFRLPTLLADTQDHSNSSLDLPSRTYQAKHLSQQIELPSLIPPSRFQCSKQFKVFTYCDNVTHQNYELQSLQKNKEEEKMLYFLRDLQMLSEIRKKRNSLLIRPNRSSLVLHQPLAQMKAQSKPVLHTNIRKAMGKLNHKYLSAYLKNQMDYRPELSRLLHTSDYCIFSPKKIRELQKIIQNCQSPKNKENQGEWDGSQRMQLKGQVILQNQWQIDEHCRKAEQEIHLKVRLQSSNLLTHQLSALYKQHKRKP